MGFEFENNGEPFSIIMIVQSMGVLIFEIIEAYIRDQPQMLSYSISVGMLGILMCGCTLMFDFKDHSDKSAEQ
jgi:hypothetical protein